MTRFLCLVALFGLASGCAQPTDAPDAIPEVPFAPITPEEQEELLRLHQNSLGLFVDRPSFGGFRMGTYVQPVEEDVVQYPPPEPRAAQQGFLGFPDSSKLKVEEHLSFRNQLQHVFHSSATIQGKSWELNDVQLIGLTVHPQPVVYEGADVPGMKKVAQLQFRALDRFEKRALARLQTGESLVVAVEADQVRVIAPIHAGKKCMNCHEQPGQMLGAFSYLLKKEPPPPSDEFIATPELTDSTEEPVKP